MKVLLLSPYPEGILPALSTFSDEFEITAKPISKDYCINGCFDYLISYGYRHILRKEILDIFGRNAINLHISLLPFCRGAHPVAWSIIDRAPTGVTIHLLDEGLDTGDILLQQQTPPIIDRHETFSTLYKKLTDSVEQLFKSNWVDLRAGRCEARKQHGPATYHRSKDLDKFIDFMPQKWDTSIWNFCNMANIRHPLLDDKS